MQRFVATLLFEPVLFNAHFTRRRRNLFMEFKRSAEKEDGVSSSFLFLPHITWPNRMAQPAKDGALALINLSCFLLLF